MPSRRGSIAGPGEAIEALIFDVDGTLAETEEVHRQAFNAAFAALDLDRHWPDRRNGWQWSVATYTRLLATTGGKERIAVYMAQDLAIDPVPNAARIAEIHATKTRQFGMMIASGGLALRDGIQEIIDRARQRGLALAVATTTSRSNVDAVCQAGFGKPALGIFDVIAAGDEVAAKKPAPDVYNLALARLALPPSSCLAFEDSRNGVLAAKAAGLRCIASPSLYSANEDIGAADDVVPDFVAAIPLLGL